MTQFELESNLLIISTFTIDKILKGTEHPANCLALYSFYYYTAKWQQTNQPEAVTKYAMKGLKLGEKAIQTAKKELTELGLIQDVQTRDELGKVTGWYIRINYLWKKETVEKIIETHPVKYPGVDSEGTNALSVSSLNALSITNQKTDSLSSLNESSKPLNSPAKFDRAWLDNFIAKNDMEEAQRIASVPSLEGLVTAQEIMETAKRMPNWCDANGKTYKNWRSAIMDWAEKGLQKKKKELEERKVEMKKNGAFYVEDL